MNPAEDEVTRLKEIITSKQNVISILNSDIAAARRVIEILEHQVEELKLASTTNFFYTV